MIPRVSPETQSNRLRKNAARRCSSLLRRERRKKDKRVVRRAERLKVRSCSGRDRSRTHRRPIKTTDVDGWGDGVDSDYYARPPILRHRFVRETSGASGGGASRFGQTGSDSSDHEPWHAHSDYRRVLER